MLTTLLRKAKNKRNQLETVTEKADAKQEQEKRKKILKEAEEMRQKIEKFEKCLDRMS